MLCTTSKGDENPGRALVGSLLIRYTAVVKLWSKYVIWIVAWESKGSSISIMCLCFLSIFQFWCDVYEQVSLCILPCSLSNLVRGLKEIECWKRLSSNVLLKDIECWKSVTFVIQEINPSLNWICIHKGNVVIVTIVGWTCCRSP